MKMIVGTITAILFAFYLIGKSTENQGVTNGTISQMEKILNNSNNQFQFKIGAAKDYETSFVRFKRMTQEELENTLKNENLNVYEISNALMFLANIHLVESRFGEGMPLMETAAEMYHNPLAMVMLAKGWYRGMPSAEGETPFKDLRKSFYYINRAFETCKVIHDRTGEKFVLDRSVGMGLGLLDSFQLSEVKKQFDYQAEQAAIAKEITAAIKDFENMYF